MVKLSASQWMLPVQGDGEIQRAIRMMQKKVFQMEQELFETSIEDEQLGDGIDYDPNVNVFGRTKTTDHRPVLPQSGRSQKRRGIIMSSEASMMKKEMHSSEVM